MMPPNFPSLRSPPHTEEGVIETLREFHVNQETLPLLCYPHAMKNLSHHLASLSVTAWVGSLWAIGYLAVPVLFYAQPDRQLAGFLAGQMFVKAGYLGMICGTYLLAYYLAQSGRAALRQGVFWAIASMLMITLIIQLGIQPAMNDLKVQALPLDVMNSALAGRFKRLHGISSIAYLLESMLGIYLLIKINYFNIIK